MSSPAAGGSASFRQRRADARGRGEHHRRPRSRHLRPARGARALLMGRVALNRIVGALVAVFGASVIAVLFLRLFPGDPARLVVGPLATPEQLAAVRHDMGLDQSLPVQYWDFISGFFTGDWGYSFGNGQ